MAPPGRLTNNLFSKDKPMKKLLACVVCFALSAMIVAAGGAGKTPKVEGTWTATSGSFGGKKVPDEFIAKSMTYITFKEGKYTAGARGKEQDSGTYTIDDKKKPAHIDLMITEGKNKGKTQLALLKIDGDVMTFATYGPDSKDRPKDFEGGDDIAVLALKRGK